MGRFVGCERGPFEGLDDLVVTPVAERGAR